MSGARARVLVAVEPLVLEGAVAIILELIGLDDVVQLRASTPDELAGVFGAAIVSEEFAADVSADVVITLPDMAAPGGAPAVPRGHVSSAAVSKHVDIRGERQIIDLLDEHLPRSAPRSDGLVAMAGRTPA